MFGSNSSKSAKVGSYVRRSIPFPFLPGAILREKPQDGHHFSPIMCDATFRMFFWVGDETV